MVMERLVHQKNAVAENLPVGTYSRSLMTPAVGQPAHATESRARRLTLPKMCINRYTSGWNGDGSE